MYVWWMQVSFFHISLIPNCEYLGIVHVSTHMCMWLRLMLLPVFILCRLQLGKLCPTGSQRFTVVHIKVPSLNKSNQSWESYFACDLNFFISRKQPLCACCVRWSGIMTMRNQVTTVKLNWIELCSVSAFGGQHVNTHFKLLAANCRCSSRFTLIFNHCRHTCQLIIKILFFLSC